MFSSWLQSQGKTHMRLCACTYVCEAYLKKMVWKCFVKMKKKYQGVSAE